MGKRTLTKLFAFALLALAAVPFFSEGGLAATPKNQLIIGTNMVSMLTLDPQNSTDPGTHLVVTNTYDYLIMSDSDNPNILHPCLAESWEEKEDGSIIFHLRKDVVFHSGNKFTAADVEYTLRRAVKAGLMTSSYFSQWGYNADNADEKFRALDDYTVIMEPVLPVTPKLKLLLLARQLGGILDSKLVKEHEKDGDWGKGWLAAHEAGSGPFVLNQWNTNDIITMSKYDNYWGEKAKMRRVMIRHLPESQVARLQLEKGDLDIGFLNIVTADLDALSHSDSVEVKRVPAAGFFYICMSVKDPDLAKAEVRRAVRHAIDYEGLCSTVLKYYGDPVKSFIPPGVPGYDPNVGGVYDPAKARAELASAGYTEPLNKQILVLSASPHAEVASVIQENLSKVGINLEIRAGAGEQVYGPMRNRQYQFGAGTTGLTGPGDPDAWVRYNMYNPDNSDESRLTNLQAWRQSVYLPEVNKLIEEAGAISDEDRRAKLYAEAVKIYEDYAPAFVPIARRVDSLAYSKRLKNFIVNPTGTTRLNEVDKD